MAAPRTDMHRLQELVRLHRLGVGPREVARLLRMSPKTELRYRTVLDAHDLLAGAVEKLPELEELRTAVLDGVGDGPVRCYVSSVDPWRKVIKKKAAEGVGPKAIHDWLVRTEAGYTGHYSSVLRMVRRLKRAGGVAAEDVALIVDTAPGEVAQVDFGYAGKFFDEATGRVRKAWVFVMVLGFSRHMFAELVFDQKVETWLELHTKAFRFFGGTPRVIVPDNLKAAVLKAAFGAADRHALELNRSYRELARFYGFKIDPTPPFSPQKKGKVESAVNYVKHNALATIDTTDIGVANGELLDWVTKTAGQRVHGTTGDRPLAVFESVEKSALLPLPAQRFKTIVWKRATVHTDSHITFDRKLYSVPWRLVGKQLWLRATPDSVEIYADDQRVATHERAYGKKRRTTHEPHLPEHRRDLMHRSESYWLSRADALGSDVKAFVTEVFASDDVLHKLRDVQAIVTHLERFPPHRIRGTVKRAQFYGTYSYVGVRNILQKALDLEPLPLPVIVSGGSLSRPQFARNPQELLAKHMEITTHESH